MEESKRNHRYLDPLSEYAATHQLPTRRDKKYKVELAEDFFMGQESLNVSKIYFCETAAPVSLIYFEQDDGEDPFPLLLFPEDPKKENEKDKKERHEFLKKNNILGIAHRKMSKKRNEGQETPSGKLKYYLIYKSFDYNGSRHVESCLHNLAEVRNVFFFNYGISHSPN